MKNIERLAINTLKMNGIAAVNQANSGHPGIVLGAAPIVYTLFTKHLVFNPEKPQWINRDRFILSAGHGSALLYAQLRILNLISEQDLKDFRQINSLTPGHPEYRHTPGVEATTGPLGQGIGVAVGLALSEAHLGAKFSEINHYTYVLCGDGDLEEGVANEALSFAGRQKLNKLIVLYDSNDIQLDTKVGAVFNENTQLKMESLGYFYQLVKENTVENIDKAILLAKQSDKPSFIEIKSIIGEGAPKEGTPAVHGAPLNEDINVVKESLNWTYDNFAVPEEVQAHYLETTFKRGIALFNNFKHSPALTKFLDESEIKIELELPQNVATRESSGQVIKWLNLNVQQFIGGSADLTSSTKAGGGDGDFDINNRKGRNILFGVREFAMATIANGISLHSNLKVFVSTFFVFVDYLKPALRLAALMKLPVTYLFSHDSIFVGEDGPTHEPVEQLAMLRSIPDIKVIRPADEVEVKAAWEAAVNSTLTPHVIVVTRQNIISTLKSHSQLKPYFLHKTNSEWNLIATGSEVGTVYQIAKELNLNLISAPNMMANDLSYDRNKSISIEAGSTFGWSKYAKYNIGIDTFGASGKAEDVAKKLKFDYNSLKNQINQIIR